MRQVEAQGSCALTSVLAVSLPYDSVHLVHSSTMPLRRLPSAAPSECTEIDHRAVLAPWALLPGRCTEPVIRNLLSRLRLPAARARAGELEVPEALLARHGLLIWTPSRRTSHRIVYRPSNGRRAHDGAAAMARAVLVDFVACHPHFRHPHTLPPTTTAKLDNVVWCALHACDASTPPWSGSIVV